jgi:C_GCAxxG_C_C family probable redox protein
VLSTKPLCATALPPDQAKAEALRRFADQGPDHINCAQAVLSFALSVRGLDPALLAAARHFGGGIAGTGETCGAVSGAALAGGLLGSSAPLDAGQSPPPLDPAATRKAVQALVRGFTAEFGSLRCRDLTGYDLTTPEGHDAFVKSGGNERCLLMVDWMCGRLLPLLKT